VKRSATLGPGPDDHRRPEGARQCQPRVKRSALSGIAFPTRSLAEYGIKSPAPSEKGRRADIEPDASSEKEARRASAGSLNSWKEIAAYLDCSVKTAQRWERDEGLPVHRHKHQRQASIYAFPSEIDAWRKQRSVSPKFFSPRSRRYTHAAAALAGLISIYLVVSSLIEPSAGDFSTGARIDGPALQLLQPLEYHAATSSPDGKSITYIDPMDGRLWRQDLMAQDRQLLASSHVLRISQWSRDGRRLAFLEQLPQTQRLSVLDAEAGRHRTLLETDRGALPTPFDWSPDAEHLLCVEATDGARRFELAYLHVDTGSRTTLFSSDEPILTPRVSPDGKWIAFASNPHPSYDVYIIPTGSNSPERIRVSGSPAAERSPVWSRDGKHLFYFQGWADDGSNTIWGVSVEQFEPFVGRPQRLATLGYWHPDFAPVFTTQDSLILGQRTTYTQARVLELAPSQSAGSFFDVRVDDSFLMRTSAHHWSGPQQFRYVKLGGAIGDVEGRDVVTVERDLRSGRETLPLDSRHPVFERSDVNPALVGFSKNVPRAYFAGKDRQQILEFDSETGEAKPFFQSPARLNSLSLSRNGRHLIMVTRTGLRGLFQMKLLRFADMQLRVVGTNRTWPHFDWSEGGEFFWMDANCLMSGDAETGETKEVSCTSSAIHLPESGFVGPLSRFLWQWYPLAVSVSPEGRFIAFTVPVPETRTVQLRIVEASSGAVQVAWEGAPEFETIPRSPIWSPGGEYIAFTVSHHPPPEIWSLADAPALFPRTPEPSPPPPE
jgi:Tol biopolymer transport system component